MLTFVVFWTGERRKSTVSSPTWPLLRLTEPSPAKAPFHRSTAVAKPEIPFQQQQQQQQLQQQQKRTKKTNVHLGTRRIKTR